MCNHYRTKSSAEVLAFAKAVAQIFNELGLTLPPDAWPKANMPVVIQAEQRTLVTMRWGVWPWYEKKMPARPVVNARDDGLLTKSIWKSAAATGRCLIPGDGFYEWCGPVGKKWEVLFHLPDERPFFFAGLWTKDPDGEGRGFTMVTGKPNELVAALPHERMPVILDEVGAMEWIGNSPLPDERLLALCAPFTAEQMIRRDMPPPIRKADLALGLE